MSEGFSYCGYCAEQAEELKEVRAKLSDANRALSLERAAHRATAQQRDDEQEAWLINIHGVERQRDEAQEAVMAKLRLLEQCLASHDRRASERDAARELLWIVLNTDEPQERVRRKLYDAYSWLRDWNPDTDG